MTKEITKAYILQQLQDKFKLRDLVPEKFTFLENVVPVYDIGSHLLKTEVMTQTKSIDSTGVKTFFKVPETEHWTLHRYTVIFATGVYTAAGVLIGRPTANDYVYLDLAAGQNVSYMNDLPKDVFLSEGNGIYVNIDGYTSTGNMIMQIDVTVEEIR